MSQSNLKVHKYPKMMIPKEVYDSIPQVDYRPMKDIPAIFLTSEDISTILLSGPHFEEVGLAIGFLRAGYIGGTTLSSCFFSLYHFHTSGKDCYPYEPTDSKVKTVLSVVGSTQGLIVFSDKLHESLLEFLKDNKMMSDHNYHAALEILNQLVTYVTVTMVGHEPREFAYTAELNRDDSISLSMGVTYA